MKQLILLLSIFSFVFIGTKAQAQFAVGKVKAELVVTKGDFKALKNNDFVGVEFTYDNMAVAKYSKEQDYLNDRVEKLNKKSAGKGDKYKEAWYNDRATRLQPNFLKTTNKFTINQGTTFTEESDGTKYTLIVNTDFTEPGFNYGVVKKFAQIRTTIKLVETANKDNVIAVMKVTGIGRTFGYNDIDTGVRISEAYAKTGKDMAKYLIKNAL